MRKEILLFTRPFARVLSAALLGLTLSFGADNVVRASSSSVSSESLPPAVSEVLHNGNIEVVVGEGDTLFSICMKNGWTVNVMRECVDKAYSPDHPNNFNPNTIHVGHRVIIPSPEGRNTGNEVGALFASGNMRVGEGVPDLGGGFIGNLLEKGEVRGGLGVLGLMILAKIIGRFRRR